MDDYMTDFFDSPNMIASNCPNSNTRGGQISNRGSIEALNSKGSTKALLGERLRNNLTAEKRKLEDYGVSNSGMSEAKSQKLDPIDEMLCFGPSKSNGFGMEASGTGQKHPGILEQVLMEKKTTLVNNNIHGNNHAGRPVYNMTGDQVIPMNQSDDMGRSMPYSNVPNNRVRKGPNNGFPNNHGNPIVSGTVMPGQSGQEYLDSSSIMSAGVNNWKSRPVLPGRPQNYPNGTPMAMQYGGNPFGAQESMGMFQDQQHHIWSNGHEVSPSNQYTGGLDNRGQHPQLQQQQPPPPYQRSPMRMMGRSPVVPQQQMSPMGYPTNNGGGSDFGTGGPRSFPHNRGNIYGPNGNNDFVARGNGGTMSFVSGPMISPDRGAGQMIAVSNGPSSYMNYDNSPVMVANGPIQRSQPQSRYQHELAQPRLGTRSNSLHSPSTRLPQGSPNLMVSDHSLGGIHIGNDQSYNGLGNGNVNDCYPPSSMASSVEDSSSQSRVHYDMNNLAQSHENSPQAQAGPANWKSTSQEIRTNFLQRLQGALKNFNDPHLLQMAEEAERLAFDQCDTQDAYQMHLAEWLANIFTQLDTETHSNHDLAAEQEPLGEINSETGSQCSLQYSFNTSEPLFVREQSSSYSSPSLSQTSSSLCEKNPLLATLLPGGNTASNDEDASDDHLHDQHGIREDLATDNLSPLMAPQSSESGVTSPDPKAFSSPSSMSPCSTTMTMSASTPSSTSNSYSIVSSSMNGFPTPTNDEQKITSRSGLTGRRLSSKGGSNNSQLNNPHSVDSGIGIGSPRSVPSNSSPKIQMGTSPSLTAVASEGPLDK